MRISNPLRVSLAAAALVTGYAFLASLPMMAGAIPPIVGVASAAPPSTTCPSPPTDGDSVSQDTPPDPKCAQPVAPCPEGNTSCTQAFSGSGSAATLFANDGTGSFFASFGPRDPLEGCNDDGPDDLNGVLDFTYFGGVGSKTIVLALRRDLVTKGIGLYNICWRSDIPFTQLGGGEAPSVGTDNCGPLGDSACFTGYLPACKKRDAGPCVLFKKSGQYNVAYFGILAPPGDPKAYPN